MGRGEHPFIKTLVESLSGVCKLNIGGISFPDSNFDPNMSTAEFYRAPMEDGFVGDNISIRRTLDYSYHCNYTSKRQHFQDAMIKNTVMVTKGSGSRKPWYVLTR